MDLTRRGFFGLLAALPFVGRFVPAQPLVIVTESVPLSDYRQMFYGSEMKLPLQYTMTTTHGPSSGGYWDDVSRRWVQWVENADGVVTERWEGDKRVI